MNPARKQSIPSLIRIPMKLVMSLEGENTYRGSMADQCRARELNPLRLRRMQGQMFDIFLGLAGRGWWLGYLDRPSIGSLEYEARSRGVK
jgi:hypothetical protein